MKRPPAASILDDLYAGTLDDQAWNRAMAAIADLMRASSALLFAYNPQTGEVLRDENHRFDPAAVAEYRRHWSYRDSRLTPMLDVPILEPMPENGMKISGWRSSAFLNEFLRPIDAPHALPAWLFKGRQKAVTLSLQGTARRGPFGRVDIERYRTLLPHIRRALEIRDRLHLASLHADSLSHGLRYANFGILVLNRNRSIVNSNTQAERLLTDAPKSIRRQRTGALWIAEPAGGYLARWMNGDQPPHIAQDGLIHVPRTGARPLSILVAPVPEQSVPWLDGDGPFWVLLLFDPLHRLTLSTQAVAHDFGLSPRESEVAALLAAGYSPKNIATFLSVSVNTVRTQLRSVFAKTETASQAQLIERLALSPASFLPSAFAASKLRGKI